MSNTRWNADLDEFECIDCGFEVNSCRCDRDDDSEYDYEDDGDERNGDCTHCCGERFVECPNPLECTRRHLGGDRFGWGGEVCPCGACGGTGRAKDQTVW
jgi:hypothetical protein